MRRLSLFVLILTLLPPLYGSARAQYARPARVVSAQECLKRCQMEETWDRTNCTQRSRWQRTAPMNCEEINRNKEARCRAACSR